MDIEGQERTDRRLAAILAADVVGYSRLMGADEEGTHVALKAVWREVTDPKLAEHHGRVVKTMGDGLLVEFASVVDAVRCAVDIQREMASRNARSSGEDPILFRIGINLGDIIIDEDDIFGDGVNVAARLEGLAPPGGICVSRIVRDQVRDKLGLGFEDMGERRVKNIARPLHVFRIPLDDPTPAVSVTKPDHARRERFMPGPLALTFSLFVAVGTVLFFVKFAPWLGGANYSTAAQPSRMIGDAVFFDKDKVVLSRSAGSTIDRQAAFLRENPKITVTIKAYCSQDEGAREGPETLAVLRVNQIRDALSARGVAGDRISAEKGCRTASSPEPAGEAVEAQNPRAVLLRN
jgi:class 3 adenylate cyclase